MRIPELGDSRIPLGAQRREAGDADSYPYVLQRIQRYPAEIDAMDADVISFEASRSDLALIDVLQESGFQTDVGPGVYDIHSPRIPGVDELKEAIRRMVEKLGLREAVGQSGLRTEDAGMKRKSGPACGIWCKRRGKSGNC